jgi:L-cysteine S-thiosulfotransferase
VLWSLAWCLGLTFAQTGLAHGQTGRQTLVPPIAANDLRSGSFYLSEHLRAQQADTVQHPAWLSVDRGADRWKNGCAQCHGQAPGDLHAALSRLPRVDRRGVVINLESQVNQCVTHRLGQSPWGYESAEMLEVTSLLVNASAGLRREITLDEPTRAALVNGESLYRRRIGQLNLSCSDCHDRLYGRHLLNEVISQGHSHAYPVYRLEWQSMGSLHRRFRSCLSGIRAQLQPQGSADFLALELYLAWRGQNLSLEIPGLRR